MRTTLACLCLSLALVACGDDDLPNTPDAATGADAPAADAPVAVIDGAPTVDAPQQIDGAPTVDAGGRLDAVPPSADAMVGVLCGTTACTGGDVCCVMIDGAGTATYSCAATCAGIVPTCDGPEDCPTAGDVCCVTVSMTPTAVCQAAATCTGSWVYEICHNNDDCTSPTATCDILYDPISACSEH